MVEFQNEINLVESIHTHLICLLTILNCWLNFVSWSLFFFVWVALSFLFWYYLIWSSDVWRMVHYFPKLHENVCVTWLTVSKICNVQTWSSWLILADIQEFYEVTLLDHQQCVEPVKAADVMAPVNLWDFPSFQSTTVTSDTLPSSLSTSIEVGLSFCLSVRLAIHAEKTGHFHMLRFRDLELTAFPAC